MDVNPHWGSLRVKSSPADYAVYTAEDPQKADRIAAAPRTEKVCQIRTPAAQQHTGYSIISSARPSKGTGILMSSALAGSKMMTNSNLVGVWTGSSPGF